MALFHNRIAPAIKIAPCTAIRRLFCSLLLSMAAIGSAQAHAQQWRIASEKDGVRLETRTLPGQRFDELRVSAWLTASPAAAIMSVRKVVAGASGLALPRGIGD